MTCSTERREPSNLSFNNELDNELSERKSAFWRCGDPTFAPATLLLQWHLRQQRVRVRAMIVFFLVRGSVRITIRIKDRVRIGITFNVRVYHWRNCRRSKCRTFVLTCRFVNDSYELGLRLRLGYCRKIAPPGGEEFMLLSRLDKFGSWLEISFSAQYLLCRFQKL